LYKACDCVGPTVRQTNQLTSKPKKRHNLFGTDNNVECPVFSATDAPVGVSLCEY